MSGNFGRKFGQSKPPLRGSRKKKYTTPTHNPRYQRTPMVRITIPGIGNWEFSQKMYNQLVAQAENRGMSVEELLKRKLHEKGF